MELKKYDNFKQFITRAMGSILVAFICISGFGFRNVEKYTIHADTYTPVQKQSFITWLLSYFGINIYTDAQQISDDVYSAVKLAYELYLHTLQPSQQVPFDKLFDGLTWDNASPNTLKLTGWLFNALKGFSDYINSQVYDPTDVDGLVIGSFETVLPGSYYESLAGVCTIISVTGTQYSRIVFDNPTRNVYIYNPSTGRYFIESVSNVLTKYWAGLGSSDACTLTYNNDMSRFNYNGQYYYVRDGYANEYLGNTYTYNSNIPIIDGSLYDISDGDKRKALAIRFCYGDLVTPGDTTLNDIFALPQQGVLDDLIGATDPEDDVQLDLSQSDINISILQSLADLIDQVNALTDSYVLDDSWPETIGKVIAQSVPISNELTDVDYPNAIDWQVPEPIATPQLIPLIDPDCPDLSACLVAGIQDVGQSLGNVIDANSNVSNYISVILFMGIALTILGGI